MAYICEICSIMFSKDRGSCPYCAGRIFYDNHSEEELVARGFAREDGTGSITSSDDSSDIFDDLHIAYMKEHGNQDNPNMNTKVDNRPFDNGSISVESEEERASSRQEISPNDFFASFVESPQQNIVHRNEDDIAEVQPVLSNHAQINEALDDLDRQQRRLERSYRRTAVWNFISSIQWRYVFIGIFVLFLIIISCLIWIFRYQIMKAIITFFLSFVLPIVIMIAIVVFLIKSIFK